MEETEKYNCDSVQVQNKELVSRIHEEFLENCTIKIIIHQTRINIMGVKIPFIDNMRLVKTLEKNK